MSPEILFRSLKVLAFPIVVTSIVGCGGSSGGSGSEPKTLTKLTLIDTAPGDNIKGIGSDGKFAYDVSHDDGSTTLYAGGVNYPETEEFSLEYVSGTMIAGDEQVTGGSWRGHLDPTTAKIVIDKTYASCWFSGVASDGTFCNEYHDAADKATRITLVSPTGVETDLPVPSPNFVVSNCSKTMVLGSVVDSPGLAKQLRASRATWWKPTRRTQPTSIAREVRGQSVPMLISKSGTVTLTAPASYPTISTRYLNDLGLVVGGASPADNSSEVAVVWSAKGVPTILAPYKTVPFAEAECITNNGVAVGWLGTPQPQMGAIWQNGKVQLASDFTKTPAVLFHGISDTWKLVSIPVTDENFCLFQGS